MKVVSNKLNLFLFRLGLILALFDLANSQSTTPPLLKSETTPQQNLKVFDAVWEKINSKYFDANFNGVNWLKMREFYRPKAESKQTRLELLAVLNEMLAELKTSHLEVWQTVGKRAAVKKFPVNFNPKTDSLYLSYGFNLKKIEGKLVVREVRSGSSAEQNNLKAGWTLLAADGKSAADPNFTFGEIYEDQKSNLRFADFENKEQNLTLTAEWGIVSPIRESRLLSENIGFIKFNSFHSGIGKWLQTEVQKFNSTKGIILDLRGNRGGYLEEVKKCLSPFFAEETDLGTFIERSGKLKETKIKGTKNKSYKGKLIVLLDDESFSGAEIMAQIIKETGRGLLVGTPSKGKVLNSIEYKLPENFRVSIAFRDYLSPKNYRLEGNGVKPDLEVLLTINDVIKARDAALEKAMETIK